jgi:hypothetical protein
LLISQTILHPSPLPWWTFFPTGPAGGGNIISQPHFPPPPLPPFP